MDFINNITKHFRKESVIVTLVLILSAVPLAIKALWVRLTFWKYGKIKREKKNLIRRSNYLFSIIDKGPEQLIKKMPSVWGDQFMGEWALYTCSMTAVAMANMAILYPHMKDSALKRIERIIDVVMSPEMRRYDAVRWGEDPLSSLNGHNSHVSYLSNLAWIIGKYKQIGGDKKFDKIYHSLCSTMNRRILQSPNLNLETYPCEDIYLPDMFLAIVALSDYSHLYEGKYKLTVDKWIQEAKDHWIDLKTGLLASTLTMNGEICSVTGNYSALNCFYLSLIDRDFANEQYKCLKQFFKQDLPFTSIKQFHDRYCWFDVDPDAGPIIMNISPSATAFAIGCATSLYDMKLRNQLLRTAEIAGNTITWRDKSHYLLANIALVGEAVTLAGRTSFKQTSLNN